MIETMEEFSCLTVAFRSSRQIQFDDSWFCFRYDPLQWSLFHLSAGFSERVDLYHSKHDHRSTYYSSNTLFFTEDIGMSFCMRARELAIFFAQMTELNTNACFFLSLPFMPSCFVSASFSDSHNIITTYRCWQTNAFENPDVIRPSLFELCMVNADL
jgi:hypothetical protein